MQNPIHSLYLNFLDFVLPIFTKLNIEFQSESPKIHEVYSKMTITFKILLEFYIDPDYLKTHDLCQIQYRNPQFYLPPHKLHVGGKCMADLAQNIVSREEKSIFLTKCLDFYVEGVHQLYKRFPLKSSYVQTLKNLQFMDPTNMNNIISIAPAAMNFVSKLNIDLNEIDMEWRMLRNTSIETNNNDIVKFWGDVNKLTKGDGTELYPNINKFVLFILILPHSSASTERIFSTVNLNKTKTRNKLSTETLQGILHSKNMLTTQKKSCFEFIINKDIIDLNCNKMYKF